MFTTTNGKENWQNPACRPTAPAVWQSVPKVTVVALTLWFAGLAFAALLVEPTREVIVFAPQARLATIVSRAPVTVLDNPGSYLRVRGTEPGFVRDLYASGAMLVMPATTGGCRGRLR